MGFKEEIKAAYGYERVYSVPAVSCISALNRFNERQDRGHSEKREDSVKFADVLEKSIREREVTCSMYGYGKTGAYEEYLYLKREYRQ